MTSSESSPAKRLNENFKFYGICVNCDRKNDCAYRQDPDKPILFCEQYEVSTISPLKISLKKPKKQTEPEKNDFLGLCINCESRFTCMFPKPEGGVWHCEEYR